jgi:colanic acid/amylovoran biosynthesis protein
VWDSLEKSVRSNVVPVTDDLGPVELAQLYKGARLVIATRFHAVVLSICGGVPVIAIPYFGMKTQGSLRDLGLSEFVIDLNRLDLHAVQSACNRIFDEADSLRSRLGLIAKERYASAMETGKKLHSLVREWKSA